MSDTPQGPGWWIASDGRWYAPELHPDHVATPRPPQSPPTHHTSVVDLSATTAPPTTAPAESSTGATRHRLILPLVAVIVLGLVGALAFSFVRGSSGAASGASSPDDAVRELIGALADGDGLGVLASLDPTEIEPIIEVSEALSASLEGSLADSDLVDQFAEFGELLPADTDLAGLIGGLDFHLGGVDGGALSVSSTTVPEDPDLARVTFESLEVSLTLAHPPTQAVAVLDSNNPIDWFSTQSFTMAEVPTGTRAAVQLRNLGNGTTRINVDALGTEFVDAEIPMRLDVMTIRRGDRWYVSIGHTALDQIASSRGNEPDYGAWRRVLADPGAGAASPDEIVTDLVDHLNVSDFDSAMGYLDPDGDRLLHSIWSVARGDVPDDFLDDSIQTEILDLQTRLVPDGSVHRLYIDRLEAADTEGEHVLIEGWCLLLAGESRECIDDQRVIDLLPEAPFVAVVEHNGRWFLSVSGTYRAWADHAVAVINESDAFQSLIEDGLTELESEFDSNAADIDAFAEQFGPITVGPVIIGPGTTTVTSGDEVVVASIVYPHVGPYDLNGTPLTTELDLVDVAAGQIESSGFAVVDIEATEPIDIALGSNWLGANQTDDGRLTGVVVISADVLRSVPVTVFPTPGKAVEVTITVTPIEPKVIPDYGSYAIELDDNGFGVVVLAVDDFGFFQISDGLASAPRYFGVPGGDVFVVDDDSGQTGEAFGLQWLGLDGEPNATVTLQLEP